MYLLLFFMPGGLIMLSGAFNKKPFSELLAYMIGFSLSFFVVFPWLLKLFNASLIGSIYLVIIGTILILAVCYKKAGILLPNINKGEAMILTLFLMVLILRLAPMLFQAAPAGADMSMHSYIARLIYDNDGVPDSYEPLLPISSFGAYPTGFPAISAAISLLGGAPVYRSSLLLTCITHALITLGLYLILLRFFDGNTAALTAIACSFLTRSPQWIIRWGGNPTILALFFFLVAFSLIIELRKGFSAVPVMLASLSFAAAFLTHPIIFYISTMVLIVYFILTYNDYADIRMTAPIFLLGTLILLAPYLINLKLSITRSGIEGARYWQDIDIRSVIFDVVGGSPFLALSAFGYFTLHKRSKEIAFPFLCIASLLVILILNYKFWFIPLSYLLYPGRIAILMVIPLSVFAAPAIKAIYSSRSFLKYVFIIIGFFFYSIYYVYNSLLMCSVTRTDIEAFRWIDRTISKKAVFGNNYGDAGIWIPAIIGRKIMNPHSEPVYSEELKQGLKKLKPAYIYIGSKAVYKDTEYKKSDLARQPWKYSNLYIKDGSQVWKILY